MNCSVLFRQVPFAVARAVAGAGSALSETAFPGAVAVAGTGSGAGADDGAGAGAGIVAGALNPSSSSVVCLAFTRSSAAKTVCWALYSGVCTCAGADAGADAGGAVAGFAAKDSSGVDTLRLAPCRHAAR